MDIDDTELLTINGFVIRVRPPATPDGRKAILMIHGWTGDENAMWIFAPRLPKNHWLIAPRGLYTAPMGGYGWNQDYSRPWSTVNELQPAIDRLIDLLSPEYFPEIDFAVSSDGNVEQRPLRLLGFSQGAALSYALALTHPEWVRGVAGLSGFLPGGVDLLPSENPVRGLPVFLAHGSRDQVVPVEKARHARDWLARAGAQVDYCEADVGHKLSVTCFHSLQVFFEDLEQAQA